MCSFENTICYLKTIRKLGERQEDESDLDSEFNNEQKNKMKAFWRALEQSRRYTNNCFTTCSPSNSIKKLIVLVNVNGRFNVWLINFF